MSTEEFIIVGTNASILGARLGKHHSPGHRRSTGGVLTTGLSNVGSNRTSPEPGLVDIRAGDQIEDNRMVEAAHMRGPRGHRFLRRLGVLIAQDGATARKSQS